jgi:hypothetical protein
MVGVFLSEGMNIQIPVGGLTLSVDERGKPDLAVRFEVALDVWPFWLDVAIDHAFLAMKARSSLKEAIEQACGGQIDATVQADLMASECKAGMVAIAAAAFALDNFYAVASRYTPKIEELQREWSSAGTARYQRISETLRRTFKVGNAGAKALRKSLYEIFRLRDWAVHPAADFREPVKHDYLDVAVEWRFVVYRETNAVNAAGAATSIISQCIGAPRPSNLPLTKWCASQQSRVAHRLTRAKETFPSASES